MSPELASNLQLLAKLLLDARVVAGAVRRQAQLDGEAWPGDYDVTVEIGALRERVAQMMEQEARR